MDAELLRGKGVSFTSNEPSFFPSKTHSEAVDILLHAVSHVAVSALLIGEIGTGKTLVCRRLQEKSDFISIYINDPFMTEMVLVQRTLRELGVSVGDRSLPELIEMLKKHLVSLNTRGQTVVLLIDDAHALNLAVLELIAFLSAEHQLVRVIFAGQPL
ncbi:MAG: AAA family ATPase, partial [Nitrospirota bacterium]